MTTKNPRVFSDLPIPPGETLAEEIEARGMTQKELAARLGRPAQVVNEIIKGQEGHHAGYRNRPGEGAWHRGAVLDQPPG